MTTSEAIHVAFVWHMHQPYYRSAQTGAFQMPWARLHALKDYLDMVEILADYPTVHQTFNLVPSLVEQLEDYACPAPGPVPDVYWQHTIKPAADLLPSERAFVIERMCEHPDHPRARSHPRYLELAQKRDSAACKAGWEVCAESFTMEEVRDLQVWFNLAWFDPTLLETEPLLSLVRRGRDFREEDKAVLAEVQSEILGRVIPAYRTAAGNGQIELSTSPYFHPILPLLINSDSARVGAADTILPHRRFAHPEDAWEQVERGVAKHQQVFGGRPRGMWCSEQAVGEDVLPLLMRAGIEWTISDETVLARSLSGSAPPSGTGAPGTSRSATTQDRLSPYRPYLLAREEGRMAIVFRDHTLSDLIGFAYQNWDSRDAANDLIGRIRDIGAAGNRAAADRGSALQTPVGATLGRPGSAPASAAPPLITIALDGENAWEYYPHDGRDFLHYLYEGLATDPAIRCVSLSEHLDAHPAIHPLDWLHTGSWIGGDLRTWSGDPGHNTAWDLLHDARDLAAGHRVPMGRRAEPPSGAAVRNERPTGNGPKTPAGTRMQAATDAGGGEGPDGAPAPAKPLADLATEAEALAAAEEAWRHVLVAEGSDWFWWFGEHHHTELDHVWDAEFRRHLRETYRRIGQASPVRLYVPVLSALPPARPTLPLAPIRPVIDGSLTDADGWNAAGVLYPDYPSTMQRAGAARVAEVRFGWGEDELYLLLIPRDACDLEGLEIELHLTLPAGEDDSVFLLRLGEDGRTETTRARPGRLAGPPVGAWKEVIEIGVPLTIPASRDDGRFGLLLRVGRAGMTDNVFRSTGMTPRSEDGSETQSG